MSFETFHKKSISSSGDANKLQRRGRGPSEPCRRRRCSGKWDAWLVNPCLWKEVKRCPTSLGARKHFWRQPRREKDIITQRSRATNSLLPNSHAHTNYTLGFPTSLSIPSLTHLLPSHYLIPKTTVFLLHYQISIHNLNFIIILLILLILLSLRLSYLNIQYILNPLIYDAFFSDLSHSKSSFTNTSFLVDN